MKFKLQNLSTQAERVRASIMSQTLCQFRLHNVFRLELCRSKFHVQTGPEKSHWLTREFKDSSCLVPLFQRIQRL